MRRQGTDLLNERPTSQANGEFQGPGSFQPTAIRPRRLHKPARDRRRGTDPFAKLALHRPRNVDRIVNDLSLYSKDFY